MRNIIDYVEAELHTLASKPFSPVDSLVLSQFSYIHLGGLIPARPGRVKMKDLLRAEHFESMFRGVRDAPDNRRLLFALAASPRFREMGVTAYVEDTDEALEKQFAAVTILLDANKAYLAFRGTDATLVGWKEDFNMAFETVPSQEAAAHYTARVAAAWPGTLYLGGHSKGGNLAVYGAMMSSPAVQARIQSVYSHDGPGFREDVFESGAFSRIRERIHKTLPESSLIGMLLENQEAYTVVQSNRLGLMQHDPFSWRVGEDGGFITAPRLSTGAQYMNKTLRDWLCALSPERRERFVDALFAVLSASPAKSFSDFSENWQKDLANMLLAIRNTDEETRAFVVQTLKALAVMAVKNLPMVEGEQRKPGPDGPKELTEGG